MLYNITPYLIKLFGHSGSSSQRRSHATLLAPANSPPIDDNNDAIKLINKLLSFNLCLNYKI